MKPLRDEKTADSSVQGPEKMPYSKPVLLQWGPLKDLTMASGSHGKSDGGKLNNLKNTRF